MKETSEITRALRRQKIMAQRCPWCTARPGEDCRLGGHGRKVSRPHVARVIAAIEAQQAALGLPSTMGHPG